MRAVLAPVLLALVVAACGGSTSSSSSGGSSGSSGASSSSGSTSSSSGTACTAVACDDGLHVAFSYTTAGAYVVSVDIDGSLVTCKATLPLDPSASGSCDSTSVLLTTVGSMLPASQQSIGGLLVTKTTAKRVVVSVTRDGVEIGKGTYDPVPWNTTPGPNGPGCDPAQCTQARVTLGT